MQFRNEWTGCLVLIGFIVTKNKKVRLLNNMSQFYMDHCLWPSNVRTEFFSFSLLSISFLLQKINIIKHPSQNGFEKRRWRLLNEKSKCCRNDYKIRLSFCFVWTSVFNIALIKASRFSSDLNDVKQQPINRMISYTHLGISNKSLQLFISVDTVPLTSFTLAGIFRNSMEIIVCVWSVSFGLKRTDEGKNIHTDQQLLEIHFFTL